MAPEFTVFVVDDNVGVRASVQNLFAAEGLKSQSFASAREFLAAYDPAHRGCLLLDVRLHKENGLDLLDELKRRRIDLPVIVMTGYGNVPTSVRAFKAGAVDFLQKPVAPEVLLGCVRGLREADRARMEAEASRATVESRIASLTRRERQVFDGLMLGKASKEIAFELGMSTRTVEGHRREVLRKMGAASAAHLVRLVLSSRE